MELERMGSEKEMPLLVVEDYKFRFHEQLSNGLIQWWWCCCCCCARTCHGTAYQKLLHALHHDQRWMADVSLGKRVGFYRFRGDLGSGNFSQVKMAIHQLCKERVAIKILDKSKLDQKTRRMLAREIATMEAIHHPNIIRLYEVVETYSKIHLVMEYASGGELFNRITTAGRIPEQDAKSLFAQVISAVTYMAEIQQLTTFCGSPPYAAPELFRDESYLGAPVDVWALGVLIYFMVTGQMPFKAQTVASLKKHIIDGNYTVPSHVSPSCKRVIEGILKQAPRERLTLNEIRDSDWLKGIPFPAPPGPSEKYSIVPTVLPKSSMNNSQYSSDNQTSLSTTENTEDTSLKSDIEMQAHEKLLELGITEAILAEHVDRGAKSSVIGTYRIIIHRLQRQESLASEIEALVLTDVENTGSSATIQSANTSGNNFCLSSLGRRSKSAAVKSKSGTKGNKNRSKTCVLL